MNAFDNLLAGISNPAIAAANLGIVAQPLKQVDLALPLLDFQRVAVDHALRDTLTKPYAYIGLDMGLGKTPCGIAIAAAAQAMGQTPILVVVPPSLRINWTRELAKFAPWLSVATLSGSAPDVNASLPDVDVLIIGDSSMTMNKYTVVDSNGRAVNPPILDSYGWAEYLSGKVAGLIVDEAHRFKNKSIRSKSLALIAKGVPGVRVLMSGTPTPNGRHAELAYQIDVMGNEAWRDIGGKGVFWHHYAPKVDQYSRVNNDGAALYAAMTGSWYHRRLRDDVLDLPNKGRTALSLEGTGRAVKEYMRVHNDLIAWLAAKQNGNVSPGQRRAAALIKMLAMRKLSGEAKVRSAVDHIKGILDNEPGGVFVVAEHRDTMDGLLMGLSKYNPTTIQGGMSDTDKQENIDAFTSGESRVLVGQITAAGLGLTLHGDGLNHRVVIVQLPWTPADLKQAEDRLHRIGQTKDVLVEVALCAIEDVWTIDERLWNQLEKKNFDSTLITDGEGEYLMGDIVDGVLDTYR